MTEEDKNAAAAYLKLQDDVRTLILQTVMIEINTRPYDSFATALSGWMVNYVIPQAMPHYLSQNYRIVLKGSTAPTY